MTRREIYDILNPMIKLITGIPTTIFIDNQSHDNARAPRGEYASVNPKLTMNTLGQASARNKISLTPGKIDQTVGVNIEARCSINFFRGAALEYAEKLSYGNKLNYVSEHMFKNNVRWRRVGPVNNLTALQERSLEQRAQIDIFIAYEITNLEEINFIEIIPIEVENEDGDILHEQDFQ